MQSHRTSGSLGRLGLLTLIALALSAPAYTQKDPSIGTWKLNLQKSKYSPGPAPKSKTATTKSDGDRIHVTVTGVTANGLATSSEYSYRLDGRNYPVTGSGDYDTVAAKESGNTVEGTRKKAGKVVQTYTRVISQDGKT